MKNKFILILMLACLFQAEMRAEGLPTFEFENNDRILSLKGRVTSATGEPIPPPAQAIIILNRIRTRAGVPNITPATKEAFKLALEQERQWEFCGEGLRWHDLVRTGRALVVMNKFLKDNNVPLGRTLTENDLLYPIPQKELLINPGFWKQNPGYN
jgi:SusD family